jgi:hypothetical protein
MLEVHVIPPNATETTYNVITDRDGHPAAAIEVDSNSDIMLLAKDTRIAKLELVAPAVDFAPLNNAKVFAVPMVEPLSICRETLQGTTRLLFAYQNLNSPLEQAILPISSMTPELFLNPLTPTDDLLLNDIRTTADQPLLPDNDTDPRLVSNTNQTFQPTRGSFTVTYDLQDGPLTWSLIGKSIFIDNSIQSCSTHPQPQCSIIPNTSLKALYREFIKTIRTTVTAGEKSMRRGSGKKINSTPQAIRTLKQLVKLVLKLKGGSICDPQAIVPKACKARPFPHKTILKLHKQIFAKAQLSNPKAFEKIRKTYHNHYAEYLRSNFPSKIYICPQ